MTLPPQVVLSAWPNGKGRADPSRDRFRQNLARIMGEQGITQAGLARTMEVSRVAVHAWIWGTCFPETSRLIKLAQTLNVTVGDLLEGDGNAGPAVTETSNEEALLLNAFRKLPNTARLSLLADAYELSARASLAAAGGKTSR
jgi:transcriptional regulator with XRE-family HTH domain